MQKKQGISLIVLVITIIVMIILAASVVVTLNNTGIIDRANTAVKVTNESQAQDLAALTWMEFYMDEYRGATLIQKVKDKLAESDITDENYNIEISDDGINVTAKATDDSIIPEGGTYYVGWDYTYDEQMGGKVGLNTGYYTGYTTILNAGEKFPELKTGDIFVYNGYEYRYNHTVANPSYRANAYTKYEELNGWSVCAIDKNATSCALILPQVNGAPVKSMTATYAYMPNLTTFPSGFNIPTTVVEMSFAFSGCTSLTEMPSTFVVPQGVEYLGATFEGCTSLTGTIAVNADDAVITNCISGTNVTGITGNCSSETKAAIMATK